MSTVRALVIAHGVPAGVRFADIPAPLPGPDEVVVRNAVSSLNFGEVRRAARDLEPEGKILGWDTAGTVSRVGLNVTKVKPGDRVVAHAALDGWAQERVTHKDDVAIVPTSVSLEQASALPTAAVTALRALKKFGDIAGRRVLVTGASGGVGRFAVQLARQRGAHVIASVGSDRFVSELEALGVDEIVFGAAAVTESVHYAIEAVGGQELYNAFQALAEDGVLQIIGASSSEPTSFPPYTIATRRRTVFSHGGGPVTRRGEELAELLDLVERGGLDTSIKWTGKWTRFAEASDLILTRQLGGKAVIRID